MATRLLSFGSYTFPEGFKVVGESFQRAWGTAKLPRTDGSRFPGKQYLTEKVVNVQGMLIRGPIGNTADYRTSLDALRAALDTGPANLTLWDDRYFRCMQAEWQEASPDTWFGRIGSFDITFRGPDTFQYGNSERSDTWAGPATGTTHTVTLAAGNATALPVTTLTVGGAGTVTLSLDLTNNTTGETFGLDASVAAGSAIVVDSLLRKVRIGTVDKMAYFSGVFPSLAVGANEFALTVDSGSLSSIGYTWHERYR